MIELNHQELLRYNRQISLRGFDIDGQEKLKNASALIIGLGGLGCAATQYLAAAGIGKLTLVDFDTVSESNLQRQVLHNNQTIGWLKVDSAIQSLQKLNPTLELIKISTQLDDMQLTEQVIHHDIVLDCTDNLVTRQQLNKICYKVKKPLVSGAAIRMEGLVTVFTYEDNQPCYHCLSQLFGQDQLTCVEAGIMSPVVGIIGSMQALEAIKVITHFGQPLIGRLLTFDAMTMQFNEIAFPKLPYCPVCADEK